MEKFSEALIFANLDGTFTLKVFSNLEQIEYRLNADSLAKLKDSIESSVHLSASAMPKPKTTH